MRSAVGFICLLICASIYPTTSISRWFSSTYSDLRFTLRRYGHCSGDLPELSHSGLSGTDTLISQIRIFLDQTNYDNEQLTNLTQLMDGICRSDDNYAVSANLNISSYDGDEGRERRCRAIDDALDALYWVFRRTATNKSEPLDFSSIRFYRDPADENSTYGLLDLINTSWIKSGFSLEKICRITEEVKLVVNNRIAQSAAEKRDGQQSSGVLRRMIEFLDGLLDPLLGVQRRLYWEGANRFETLQTRISGQLGGLRDGIGKGYKSTRDRITGLFVGSSNSSSPRSNVTSLNVTNSIPRSNNSGSGSQQSPATTISPSSSMRPTMLPSSAVPTTTTSSVSFAA